MPNKIYSRKEREVLKNQIINNCRIENGKQFRLADHNPSWEGPEELRSLSDKKLKARAKAYLARNQEALNTAQELLYASNQYAILLIFQAMDAAGKDGTIKHVMSGVNPQGCQVYSFKKPSTEELSHNYLWRYIKRMPERGHIGIFNRSYYEEVLVVRVHPEMLMDRMLSRPIDEAFWQSRYDDINSLEHHMTRNRTIILKFFLNVSKLEQRRRFLERLENPEKHWKFSSADLEERQSWDQYMEAFEAAISATSTEWAPWYVIPADHKVIMRTIVSQIIAEKIESLNLSYPKVNREKANRLKQALEQLKANQAI